MMSNTWEKIKKVFVAIGLFIAGFFIIRRGIDVAEVAKSRAREKAKEDALKAKAELKSEQKKQEINNVEPSSTDQLLKEIRDILKSKN